MTLVLELWSLVLGVGDLGWIRSVPPRGSGWAQPMPQLDHSTKSDHRGFAWAHPLPRGGTDLVQPSDIRPKTKDPGPNQQSKISNRLNRQTLHSTFSHIFTSRVTGGKQESSLQAWNRSLPLMSPDPPE